jgi:hypothetical protein
MIQEMFPGNEVRLLEEFMLHINIDREIKRGKSDMPE